MQFVDSANYVSTSERNYEHEGPDHQQDPSTLHPRPDVSFTQAPQIQLVGHSIVRMQQSAAISSSVSYS